MTLNDWFWFTFAVGCGMLVIWLFLKGMDSRYEEEKRLEEEKWNREADDELTDWIAESKARLNRSMAKNKAARTKRPKQTVSNTTCSSSSSSSNSSRSRDTSYDSTPSAVAASYDSGSSYSSSCSSSDSGGGCF